MQLVVNMLLTTKGLGLILDKTLTYCKKGKFHVDWTNYWVLKIKTQPVSGYFVP